MKHLLNFFTFIRDKRGYNSQLLQYKLLNDVPLDEKDLIVNGDLFLNNRGYTYIPEGLRIKGSLVFESNTKIKKLPNDLVIEGGLIANDTLIKAIPPSVRIGGNIEMSNTLISYFTSSRKVKGHLWLNDTNITSLSPDLEVKGNLYLVRTPISKKYTYKELRRKLPKVKGDIFI